MIGRLLEAGLMFAWFALTIVSRCRFDCFRKVRLRTDACKMSFVPDSVLREEHQNWLSSFDPRYARNWERLFANDPEAAMCEAAFRRVLEHNGNRVSPNEHLDGQGRAPDFRCEQDTAQFYVEVTCLNVAQVTKRTALQDKPGQAGHYRLLNDMIFEACSAKVPQCANLDAPALLAIGTWHFSSSVVHVDKHQLGMLLTGQLGMAWSFDAETGSVVGEPEQVTQLWSSAFVQPGPGDSLLKLIRLPLSGLLVGGLDPLHPRLLGILHPQPNRPFRPELLPEVEFGRLAPGYAVGEFGVQWINGNDSRIAQPRAAGPERVRPLP